MYSTAHSIETALLRARKDILHALDIKKSAIIVLLDKSAAINAIDHTILPHMLEDRYGIGEMAFKWSASYIVMSTGDISEGSGLGPLNFIVYSSPADDICRKRGLACCLGLYADDTQLLTFKHGSTGCDTVTIRTMEACIANIRRLMTI